MPPWRGAALPWAEYGRRLPTSRLKSTARRADSHSVISAAKVLDRGRLLLGLLLVAPFVAVVPTGARSSGDSTAAQGGGQWSATSTPNPIKAITDPKDVVDALTQQTIEGLKVITADGKTRQEVIEAATAASDAGEIGTEASSSKDAAAAPGEPPVAVPGIAQYPVAPDEIFTFPIVGGASFTNDWGGERPEGRSHQGIDLFARQSTPIVAPVDGVLYNVGWNRLGGWRLWIRDQWGNEYYFAHLSAFAPDMKDGLVVTRGTVIGFVGNTGDAKTTPPHLHLEIHPRGGDPIPPFPYVSTWARVGG